MSTSHPQTHIASRVRRAHPLVALVCLCLAVPGAGSAEAAPERAPHSHDPPPATSREFLAQNDPAGDSGAGSRRRSGAPPQWMTSGTYVGDGQNGHQITGVGFQPDVVIVKGEMAPEARVKTQTMGGDLSKALGVSTALESGRIINIKPGRVGGFSESKAIHDLCERAKIPCWVGGMLESGVGSAHCVALAMLDNFTYPADIFPSERFYHEDLADPPLRLCHTADGVPSVRALPELAQPLAERLQRWTQQTATV